MKESRFLASRAGSFRPRKHNGLLFALIFIASATPARAATSAVKDRPLETQPFELTFWNSIKDSGNSADFRDYLERYPDGQFAGVARRRQDSLEAARRAEANSPAREKAARPANVFEITHAHRSFTTLRFAAWITLFCNAPRS